MRSKAHIKTHPLHPILIAFPIAFYLGTLLFDVLAVCYNDLDFAITGKQMHIAAIIGAVAAAIPGIIDYIYTVPPQSSAKKRAAKHGLINSTVLILFSVVLYLKYSSDLHPYTLIGLEAIGVTLTGVAGWMGGTLVHRNQIGVDIRYAHAGKWKEKYFEGKNDRIEVCAADELLINQMKLMHINDKRIVIAKTEEGYVAFDARCPHKGGSLAGGAMICGTVQCPWHGSQFDCTTGKLHAGPAKDGIAVYKVEENDGNVYLML